VVERFGPVAATRGITLEVTGAATARADRDRVTQILANYLSNAIRHAPADSTVGTELTQDGAFARLAVRDEGPGLTDEQREAVFQRFYRVDAARSRVEGGSGIGLAIVAALAGAMGGRAWAESAGPATGSMFLVELPAALRES
jgi:signal transduction histidine kinase